LLKTLTYAYHISCRFIKRKRELGDRQSETLARLEAFSSSLLKARESSSSSSSSSSMYAEAYSGQVLDRGSSDEEGEGYGATRKSTSSGGGAGGDDTNNSNNDARDKEEDMWFAGKLKFRRHVDDDLRK
jgi:hypothetical protein